MRELVEDTLKQLSPIIPYTQEAAELGLGTIAQESAYGKYRRQLGGGPGLGICQIEPDTFKDNIDNYLAFRPALAKLIMQIAGVTKFDPKDLEFNDKLSICMMRVKYARDKEKIPSNLEGWAAYWKRVYNTIHGKGKESEFIHNYQLHVLKKPLA